MLKNAITHWKTSTAGVLLGATFLVALNAFKPGMSLKQWTMAAGGAILIALPHLLASDASNTVAIKQ